MTRCERKNEELRMNNVFYTAHWMSNFHSSFFIFHSSFGVKRLFFILHFTFRGWLWGNMSRGCEKKCRRLLRNPKELQNFFIAIVQIGRCDYRIQVLDPSNNLLFCNHFLHLFFLLVLCQYLASKCIYIYYKKSSNFVLLETNKKNPTLIYMRIVRFLNFC